MTGHSTIHRTGEDVTVHPLTPTARKALGGLASGVRGGFRVTLRPGANSGLDLHPEATTVHTHLGGDDDSESRWAETWFILNRADGQTHVMHTVRVISGPLVRERVVMYRAPRSIVVAMSEPEWWGADELRDALFTGTTQTWTLIEFEAPRPEPWPTMLFPWGRLVAQPLAVAAAVAEP